MKKIVLVFLLMCVGISAHAQTLKHDFSEDRTVYLDFLPVEKMEGTVLLTMELKGRECTNMYESVVQLNNQKIEFENGTTWDMTLLNKSEVRVDFPRPDSTGEVSVVYERAEIDPKEFCLTSQDKNI